MLIDQIGTLGIIVEQTIEWQTLLYVSFIDFEKTSDSVDMQSMWNIPSHYGVPSKVVMTIKHLYEDSSQMSSRSPQESDKVVCYHLFCFLLFLTG